MEKIYRAKICVTLKAGVLDPQGSAVEKALNAMDIGGVEEVRVGKYMEVLLSDGSLTAAKQKTDEMCRRLLSNPVIEDYSFELVEV